jgi:hypothetical protein
MNPPPFYVVLFGNLIGFLALFLAGLVLFASWLNDQAHVPMFIAILGIVLSLRAVYARWQYVQFQRWQRTTEDFAGLADQRAAEQATRNRRTFAFASIAAWCGCIWWVHTYGSRNEWSGAASTLWVGISCAWLFVVLRLGFRWLTAALRSQREATQHQRERDHTVSVAAPKRHSPTPDDARANLPDYVQDLMNNKGGQ